MQCVQVVSLLALKRLAPGWQPAQASGSGVADHLERALRQANARAWFAIELLLAGKKLWERAQLAWTRELEGEFYRPLRFLLSCVSLDDLSDEDKRNCWGSLRAALAAEALTSGALLPADLAAAAAGAANPESEVRCLENLAADLGQAGFGALKPLLHLRSGADGSLLVALAAALLRHAVESDPDLFESVLQLEGANGIPEEFHQLAVVLDRHRGRLEAFLEGLPPPASTPPPPHAERPERDGHFACDVPPSLRTLPVPDAAAPIYLQRGDAHRLNADYAQAVSEYSTALRFEPFNSRALVQRGQMYLLTGQWQEAVADFTAALQVEPSSPTLYHQRGKALLEAGDLEGAIVNFSEALRLDPSYAWAHHDSGEAYAAKKDYERAVADYSEAIRLNPLLTVSYLRRGEAYAALRSYERAVADYNNALRLDPHNPAAYQCRGAAYRELGKLGLAENDFTRALDLDFGNAHLYYERGLLFQQHGNHQRALLDLNAALSRRADFPEAYYRRGLTHQALGDDERALADLGSALRLEPKHAAAHNSRGLLFATRNELELAFEDFSEAVQIEPRFAEALVNRAKVLSRLSRLEEALADCDEAIVQNPHLTDAYLTRGSILGQQGKYDAAVEEFSRGLRLGLRSAPAYYLRGLAYLRLGDTPRALADLTQTLRLDPQHARAYAQRAAVREAAGQHEPALRDLAQAACLDRQFAAAFCTQAALFHDDAGKHDLAAAFFTATLLLDPGNTDAEAGRVQAWKAHLAEARERRLQKTPSRQAVPPLRAEAGLEALAPAGTNGAAATDTMEGPVARGGALVTGLEHPPLPNGKPVSPSEEETPGDDTSFVLNVPDEVANAATVKAANEDTSFVVRVPVESAKPPSTPPADDRPSAQQQGRASEEPSYTVEELRTRAEAEQALRAQLAEEFRRKQDQAIRQDTAREAAKKARKARKDKGCQQAADDEDGRLPAWKKGALVVASVLILYWSFGAIKGLAGIFYNPNAPEFDSRLVEQAITVEELHQRFSTWTDETRPKQTVVRGVLAKQPDQEQDHVFLEISGRGEHATEVVHCALKPKLGNHQMMLLSRIEGNGSVTVVGTCTTRQGARILMNECLLVQVSKGSG